MDLILPLCNPNLHLCVRYINFYYPNNRKSEYDLFIRIDEILVNVRLG